MRKTKDYNTSLGEKILQRLIGQNEYSERVGDIQEVYSHLRKTGGKIRAKVWYWTEIVKNIVSTLINKANRSVTMLKNYFKIAIRNTFRYKVYSILNIIGLSIGIAGCILILLYVKFEFSYDKYHKHSDNIYRVYMEFPYFYKGTNLWAGTCGPLAKTLLEEYPEVISAVRLETTDEILVSYGENKFLENKFFYAEPDLFNIFSFQLTERDPVKALEDPYSVIISRRMAEKYFGGDNPVGKILTVKAKYDLKVTGILDDIPENSHFTMDFIVPWEIHETLTGIPFSSWYQTGLYTYILLEENASPADLEAKLPVLLNKYWDGNGKPKDRYRIQAMTDIHLHSNMLNEIQENNDIKYIYMLTGIAVLIIFIACFNFMNMATARSLKRAKEVGIRKVAGAQKKQLLRQFLCESFVLTLLSFLGALVIVYSVLPVFNSFIERDLTLSIADLVGNISWFAGIIILVSLIAGSYPAFLLSAFKPVNILKGSIKGDLKGKTVRNILVIAQFSTSIVLIISSMAIQHQLSFIKSKDLGLDRDNIVTVRLQDRLARDNINIIKAQLIENPEVVACSSSRYLLFGGMSQTRARWPENKDEDNFLPIYVNTVDYGFLEIYGIKVTEGRDFSKDFSSDAAGAFLLNESAVNMVGFKEPVGRDFILSGHFKQKEGKIVGIMKDFHFQSLRLKIEPIQFLLDEETANSYLSIKIKPDNIPETLEFIKSRIAGFSPNYPVEYEFFNELFDRAYKSEQKLGQIMNLFSALTIIIACLGLLGLSSYIVEQRMKEIGIRKALGASFKKIINLLSLEFSFWIILAVLIACPTAYFIVTNWLSGFSYRAELSPVIFISAALFVILIALGTVSFHSVRAALTKTVNTLRYE